MKKSIKTRLVVNFMLVILITVLILETVLLTGVKDTIFGYVTATFATFFIGRDAEEKDAPVAGAKDIEELKIEMLLAQG